MLWVWPSSNPEAWIESYANPPPTDPELQDPSWISAGSEWDFVEQPVSWQTLVSMTFAAFCGIRVPDKGMSSDGCGETWRGMDQGQRHCELGSMALWVGREAAVVVLALLGHPRLQLSLRKLATQGACTVDRLNLWHLLPGTFLVAWRKEVVEATKQGLNAVSSCRWRMPLIPRMARSCMRAFSATRKMLRPSACLCTSSQPSTASRSAPSFRKPSLV